MIARILDFIRETLATDDGTVIDADTPLFSAQVLDSMCLMELVVFIEDQAGIKVRPAELAFENFDTVNHMAKFIARKQQRAVPQPGVPRVGEAES